MSNQSTYNKAVIAYVLQKVANQEIYSFGRASTGVMNRLLAIIDTLDEQGENTFIRLCAQNLLDEHSNDVFEDLFVPFLSTPQPKYE